MYYIKLTLWLNSGADLQITGVDFTARCHCPKSRCLRSFCLQVFKECYKSAISTMKVWFQSHLQKDLEFISVSSCLRICNLYRSHYTQQIGGASHCGIVRTEGVVDSHSCCICYGWNVFEFSPAQHCDAELAIVPYTLVRQSIPILWPDKHAYSGGRVCWLASSSVSVLMPDALSCVQHVSNLSRIIECGYGHYSVLHQVWLIKRSRVSQILKASNERKAVNSKALHDTYHNFKLLGRYGLPLWTLQEG